MAVEESLVSLIVVIICAVVIICHLVEKGAEEREARRAEDEWNWEHNSYKKF